MYMLVSIASALVSVYACMLGCMYVCELGGSFAGGCPSLAICIVFINRITGYLWEHHDLEAVCWT